MKTYMLTGDPEKGMNGPRWNKGYQTAGNNKGYVDTTWQAAKDCVPGAQVILLRTGKVGGIIGFGHRVEGDDVTEREDGQEAMRFYNTCLSG